MSEWISVEDRLPEEGQKVLVSFIWFESRERGNAVLLYGNYDDHNWRTADDGSELDYSVLVTHWTPLPEAPECSK